MYSIQPAIIVTIDSSILNDYLSVINTISDDGVLDVVAKSIEVYSFIRDVNSAVKYLTSYCDSHHVLSSPLIKQLKDRIVSQIKYYIGRDKGTKGIKTKLILVNCSYSQLFLA